MRYNKFIITLIIFFISQTLATERSIEDLVKEIYKQQELYKEGKHEISELQYSKLLEELRQLAPDHPLLQDPIPNTNLVTHRREMKSLRKFYEKAEVLSYLNKLARNDSEQFLVQIKYDGIAINYQDQKLLSKGDGQKGYDLSQLLPFIDFLGHDKSTNFRAELIFRESDFQKLLKSNQSSYVSPRHAVVALSNMKEEKLDNLKDIKLTLVNFQHWQKKLTLKDIDKQWEQLVKEVKDSDFPNDGIVFKLADQEYSKGLTPNSQYIANAVCFKWKSQPKVVQLKSVSWSFSERGLVPVANFDTVMIEGRKISRVTLHNFAFIQKKQLALNDYLEIELKGGTIPVLKSNFPSESRTNIELKECPSCQSSILKQNNKLNCSNKACPGQITREALKVYKNHNGKGLGFKTLEKIIKHFKISTVEDLWNLTTTQLQEVSGIGKVKSESISQYFQAIGNRQ